MAKFCLRLRMILWINDCVGFSDVWSFHINLKLRFNLDFRESKPTFLPPIPSPPWPRINTWVSTSAVPHCKFASDMVGGLSRSSSLAKRWINMADIVFTSCTQAPAPSFLIGGLTNLRNQWFLVLGPSSRQANFCWHDIKRVIWHRVRRNVDSWTKGRMC